MDGIPTARSTEPPGIVGIVPSGRGSCRYRPPAARPRTNMAAVVYDDERRESTGAINLFDANQDLTAVDDG